MEKILVLLATYNGEKYLREQLDSIYGQECVDVAVLVRDDDSSDGTIKILNEYKNRKRLEWYKGDHLNVQKGYYDLMKKASKMDYQYFAFSDQDDVWDKDKLLIGVDAIKGKAIPALYYCGQRLVDENLRFIADHELNKKRNFLTRFVLSDFAGCTGVFNIELLQEVVKFEPEYMLMHDSWILKVCLCLGGTVAVDPGIHISYRQHGGNTVGLGRSIFAYLKQVKQYMNEYQVERQIRELVRGYGNRMISPYKEMSDWICNYKNNKKYKKHLLNRDNIDFCKKGLNLIYNLKIYTGKL